MTLQWKERGERMTQKVVNNTDLTGYSDTLGPGGQCDCEQMVLCHCIQNFWTFRTYIGQEYPYIATSKVVLDTRILDRQTRPRYRFEVLESHQSISHSEEKVSYA